MFLQFDLVFDPTWPLFEIGLATIKTNIPTKTIILAKFLHAQFKNEAPSVKNYFPSIWPCDLVFVCFKLSAAGLFIWERVNFQNLFIV